MDFSTLVDEITRRVLARMQSASVTPVTQKPRLLVLSATQNARLDHFLTTTPLRDCYELCCGTDPCPDDTLDSYEAMILMDLRMDELGRISSGIGGTPYSSLVIRAILSGKRIYLPACEIELLCYEPSAPPRYYAMMKDQLNLLEQSGITICSLDELEKSLMGSSANLTSSACKSTDSKLSEINTQTGPRVSSGPPFRVSKRVLTEKDLIEAKMKGASAVLVRKDCIITDLACEYARARQLNLVRDS